MLKYTGTPYFRTGIPRASCVTQPTDSLAAYQLAAEKAVTLPIGWWPCFERHTNRVTWNLATCSVRQSRMIYTALCLVKE